MRRNHADEMQTATFSTSVAHVHAVERKPLFHFRPGLRVLTLASPGCNLRCGYCLNDALSRYGRDPGVPWSGEAVDVPSLLARARAEGTGIAFSYSEPTLSAELLLAIAAEAGDLPLVWKTNGFIRRQPLRQLARHVAAANVDLKTLDEAEHRRLTGAPLSPVLDTISELVSMGVWVEISTPVLPEINDRREAIESMAKFILSHGVQVPWHLGRYLPVDGFQGPPTDPGRLAEARSTAREIGLSHVYVERALGPDGRRTRCPRCRSAVVERDLWESGRSALKGGQCPGCGASVAGRW